MKHNTSKHHSTKIIAALFALGISSSSCLASCAEELSATLRFWETESKAMEKRLKELPTSGIKACEFYRNIALPSMKRNINDLMKFHNCSAYEEHGRDVMDEMDDVYVGAKQLTEKTCADVGM
jgi:hypothetical protein